MKIVEAVVPHLTVNETIDELRKLEVGDVVVESVKVSKKDRHQTMVYRGCAYDQDFTTESRIQFLVSDEEAPQAESVVSHATSNYSVMNQH